MSAFPTGVAVVTALDAAGSPRGMTCSSLTSVTLHPPTLVVCLRRGSVTLDAVLASRLFAVNLLHARARRTAELFAGSVTDRFAEVRWHRSWSGLPWLVDDAFALAECVTADCLSVGDHAMVLGEVGWVAQSPDVPLLYGLRSFSTWPVAGATDGRSS